MKVKQLIIACALIVSLFFYKAIDHPTHLHNAWVFNKMISEGTFYWFDSYTGGGNQFLWSYGVPTNASLGLLWFIFGEWAIIVFEAVTLAVFMYYSRKIIKDEKMLLLWWLLTYLVIPMTGATAYLLSYTLFFVGVTKKGKLRDSLQLLASINHLYASMTNLLLVGRGRNKFFKLQLGVLIAQLSLGMLVKTEAVSSGFMILGVFWFRLLAMVFPYIYTDLIKLKPGLKRVKNPGRLNKAYKIGFTSAIAFGSFIVPIMSSIYFVEPQFSGIDINGTVRLVDTNNMGVYELPIQGVMLSTSQYFHEQNNLIFNKSEYFEMLEKQNINYVIYCSKCLLTNLSYEKRFLEEEFPIIFKNEDYYVFNVTEGNRKL